MVDARLFFGGTILTMDKTHPTVEAVGAMGDRIIATGPIEQVSAALPAAAKRYDLAGRTMMPGFNEAHNHMIGFGETLQYIDCGYPAVTSIDDIVGAVGARAASQPKGTWVIGRGYDDNKLEDRRHPNRQDLDSATTDHPVMIVNGSGHLAAVNSLALALAACDRCTRLTPKAATLFAMSTANQTGVLHETAQEPNSRGDPSTNRRRLRPGTEASATTPTSELASPALRMRAPIRPIESVPINWRWRRGDLKLRTSMMIRENLLPQIDDLGIMQGLGSDRLRIGPIKMFIDGSLIGRTAAVTIPFLEDPAEDNLGLTMMSAGTARRLCAPRPPPRLSDCHSCHR